MKGKTAVSNQPVQRLKFDLQGALQGVGFRPFVFRLAQELHLTGWVRNTLQGVTMEIEGPLPLLNEFSARLDCDKPVYSSIRTRVVTPLRRAGFRRFEIRPSEHSGARIAVVLPDLSPCKSCLREIVDPRNRRYRYPFTNCTQCGPRFSIIEKTPYDRQNTSMKLFALCEACQREFDDPSDRRFHAQPNACPVCGPRLEFRSRGLNAGHHNALLAAADLLRQGKTLALKGVGGFHLMADARNAEAVQQLRRGKHRAEKPFAVMFPSLPSIRTICRLSSLERRILASPAAPIVLLERFPPSPRASDPRNSLCLAEIAPNNPDLGVLLPHSPLHFLLLKELRFPVVATSGNLSDEPLCIDNLEALERLAGVADGFLLHDRPILRPLDDSVVRVLCHREVVLRLGRGLAPCSITLPPSSPGWPPTIWGLGAEIKSSLAFGRSSEVILSQHLPNLGTPRGQETFARALADLTSLYEFSEPQTLAHDSHPDYFSTQFAQSQARSAGQPLIPRPQEAPVSPPASNSPAAIRRPRAPRTLPAQHHEAHVLSCMLEHQLAPPALGIAWDGTGYGLDGTIWGGESLLVLDQLTKRVGTFRAFPLPGGETAVKEPRRAALGLLWEIFGGSVFDLPSLAPVAAFTSTELSVLGTMLNRKVNSPLCSSAGRLFDAAASILNLRHRNGFEGQAAIELEAAARRGKRTDTYPIVVSQNSTLAVWDWEPMIRRMLEEVRTGVPPEDSARKFHFTLAELIVTWAQRTGVSQVVLSGGCFQNKTLTEQSRAQLVQTGFNVYCHQRIPPNDGGIAAGQIAAALRYFSCHPHPKTPPCV